MTSTTNIIINLKIEGTHNWPKAKEVFPDVGFLSDPHRHIFWIKCKKMVTHDDRDVEIIRFKREIRGWLHSRYGKHTGEDQYFTHLDLGAKSCEMLARELADEFGLNYCEVLEDGENGAEIIVETTIHEDSGSLTSNTKS